MGQRTLHVSACFLRIRANPAKSRGPDSGEERDFAEEVVLLEHFGVGPHQQFQSLLPHVRNGHVPVAALVVEGHLPLRTRVGLQFAVKPTVLSGGSEQRQQGVGQGGDQQ